MESEVLRHFYGDLHEVITDPARVARLLYQEGIVPDHVLHVVNITALPLDQKNATIMDAVRAAVKADPKTLWILIAVLEKIQSAPLAKRMREKLYSMGKQHIGNKYHIPH